MDHKMTSGEIAKKAGISQKAVRLYDEKGLLKPADYSEGNYRLYDQESLLILEKIIALKQIGFSLEEIKDNLQATGEQDIKSTLRDQVRLMEEKKYQLEKSITAINRTLERNAGKLDWDSAAEILRMIGKDQSADERCWDARKHTGDEPHWYGTIFQSLDLKADQNILDLGCGYAELWRDNWQEIPAGTRVYGYDLHGTWADDFAKFVPEHKDELPENVEISVNFYDVETKEAWEHICGDGKYDRVIAHYINNVLHDKEKFFARIREVLKEDGMFSFNGAYVSSWKKWLKEIFEKLNLDSGFLEKQLEREIEKREELSTLLQHDFSRVESVLLPNRWHYTDAEDLLKKVLESCPGSEKELQKYEKKLKQYFSRMIAENGEIVIEIQSQFWHCYR